MCPVFAIPGSSWGTRILPFSVFRSVYNFLFPSFMLVKFLGFEMQSILQASLVSSGNTELQAEIICHATLLSHSHEKGTHSLRRALHYPDGLHVRCSFVSSSASLLFHLILTLWTEPFSFWSIC